MAREVPDHVWEAMESLPDWNGRRGDTVGLASYWAKRARAAERKGAVDALTEQRDELARRLERLQAGLTRECPIHGVETATPDDYCSLQLPEFRYRPGSDS